MNISYSDVSEYCNELHVLANKLQSDFSDIKDLGTSIVSKQMWSGPASAHYQAKINLLVSNFDDVYRELEASILFLAKASDGYQAIDNDIIREICSNLNITEPTLDISTIYGGL